MQLAIPNLMVDPGRPTEGGLVPTLSDTQHYLPTPSNQVTPTENPIILPTRTNSLSRTNTSTVCVPPGNWVIYVVQPNDNLFNLGIRYSVSVSELQIANCMGNTVTIYAGQRLYVPFVEMHLDDFAQKWDEKYPTIAKSWRDNWEHLIPFFAYPEEIRKVIYTTNAVESVNASIRKKFLHFSQESVEF